MTVHGWPDPQRREAALDRLLDDTTTRRGTQTMATTYEKMQALAAELRTQALGDTSEEAEGFVTLVQLAAGFGIDVFEFIIPDDPAQADVFVDQLLALFVRVRGDDLPPFDPNLYGEARADVEPVYGETRADLEPGLPE